MSTDIADLGVGNEFTLQGPRLRIAIIYYYVVNLIFIYTFYGYIYSKSRKVQLCISAYVNGTRNKPHYSLRFPLQYIEINNSMAQQIMNIHKS